MSEKDLIESLEIQLQGLRKDLEALREAKKKPEEGHWITVHSDGGHGTHIFIKGDGSVGKGPTGLVGKKFPKAAKKAAKRPSKPSGGTGLGGTMAGTSSLPSSGGGMIDISKYQTSIPLTPAAPKAAAKPAPAPKAPKVEPPKPAGPQNIDIGGYKFEMPKTKPTEAPKPAEPPKAVEPPKPLEAPKAVDPTKGKHEHWNDIAKSKYLGTIAKGTHIPGKLNTLASGDITDENGKTTGDVHVFDSAVAALSAKGADMKKDPNNTNLYAYPSKGIKVHDDKASAEKAHGKALTNNISFIRLKNFIDGKHEGNELASANEMTPYSNYMYTVEPKEFSTPTEAAAAFKNESKATHDKLIANGYNKDFADQITKQIHPPKNYIVIKKKVSSSENPQHTQPSSSSAIPSWYSPTPIAGSSKSKETQTALNILANPTGVKGGLFVNHGETKYFPSHDEASWAYKNDFETTIRNLKKTGISHYEAMQKANSIMNHERYRVDQSIQPTQSNPPIHANWQYGKDDYRPLFNQAPVKEISYTSVSPSIRQSVLDYSGDSFYKLNKSLYNQDEMNEKSKKMKSNLEKFIAANGEQPEPITVWRGIRPFKPDSDKDLDYVSHDEMLERFSKNIGNVITLDGFQSASLKPHKALAFSGADSDEYKFVFEIKTKHGGRMTEDFSHSPGEAEFLLGHGWNYRVVGVEKVPFDYLKSTSSPGHEYRTVVKLEHIP